MVSILVALVGGVVEVLGVVGDQLGLKGGVWAFIGPLNQDSGRTSFLVALFAGSWIVSAAMYRLEGYDRIEVEDA